MTTANEPPLRDQKIVSGGGLRVVFARDGDRWRHEVELTTGAMAESVLLQSIEGGSDPDWPASPPVQEIQIDRLAAGRAVALAVGMAGTAYWSLSCEPILDSSGGVAFDLACRIGRDPPGTIHSTYRIASGVSASFLSGEILLESAAGRCTMRPLEGAGLKLAASTLTITPPETPSEGRRGSYRWRYAIVPLPKAG